MLGQGMRQAKNVIKNSSHVDFKTNRSGYLKTDVKPININVIKALLDEYDESYLQMLGKCGLLSDIDLARKFIEERYNLVVGFIPSLNKDLHSVIKASLGNVDYDTPHISDHPLR